MAGSIVAVSRDTVRGWAYLVEDDKYAATVHLVHRDVILVSTIADRPGSDTGSAIARGDCWFEFDISKMDEDIVSTVVVLVGESGEVLVFSDADRRDNGRSSGWLPHVVRTSAKTYRDGLAAGLSTGDIIELLYIDILRRSADPFGLTLFSTQIEAGNLQFDQVRHSFLESPEYKEREIKVSAAAGRTFTRKIAYLASERRRHFETYLESFLHSPAPMRERLLKYFPGLLASGATPGSLEEDARIGLPDREIFFRALDTLAGRPSLILGLVPSDEPREPRDTSDTVEIEPRIVRVSCTSSLLASGWQKAEENDVESFRWMEQVGLILNPYPERRISSVEVAIRGWYGTFNPTIHALNNKAELATSLEGAERGRHILRIAAADGSFAAPYVVVVATGATCPMRFDGSGDRRVLSINVSHVSFHYEEIT